MCPPVHSDTAVNGAVVTDEQIWILGGLLIARDTHNSVLEPDLSPICAKQIRIWRLTLDAGRVEWEAGDSLAGLQDLCSSLIPSVIVLSVIFSFYNRSPPSVQPPLYKQMHGVRYPGKLIRAGPQLIERLRTFYEIRFHYRVYKNRPLSLFWAKCILYCPLILIFEINFNIILTYMCNA